MLYKLGFPQVWINRFMKCVKTVSCSFLRDGKVFGNVYPRRGVRQGDPISLYLYILCVEGLTGIMRRYDDIGLINLCKVARGARSISHLLFANNCYFFFKVTQTGASIMKSILHKYEMLSGQVLNYNNSDVIFSPNTCTEDRSFVCDCLRERRAEKPGKYLGMSIWAGKNKMEVFAFVSDRVQSRLQGLWNKDLLKPGKLTLLKSAAQTIPNFWKILFLIPESLCYEIERKINIFYGVVDLMKKESNGLLGKNCVYPKSMEA